MEGQHILSETDVARFNKLLLVALGLGDQQIDKLLIGFDPLEGATVLYVVNDISTEYKVDKMEGMIFAGQFVRVLKIDTEGLVNFYIMMTRESVFVGFSRLGPEALNTIDWAMLKQK